MEIVAAPYVGVFNVAIAFGAWAGGQAVDGPGLSANLWLAAGFAAAALLSFSEDDCTIVRSRLHLLLVERQ